MPIYKQTTEITNIDDLLSSVERDIEEVYFGDKQIFTVWAEYDGTLPATYTANGDYIADYRIYGATGGVGDRTENLWDVPLVQGAWRAADGAWLANNTGYVSNTSKISVDAETTYSFVFTSAVIAPVNRQYTYFWGDNNAYLGYQDILLDPVIHTPSNATHITVSIGVTAPSGITPQDVSNVMLTEGSTAPPEYVPYGYEVDMSVSDGTTSTTTSIYIGSDPLEAISEFADFVDYSARKIIHKIIKIEFTGEEDWKTSSQATSYIPVSNYIRSIWGTTATFSACSHFSPGLISSEVGTYNLGGLTQDVSSRWNGNVIFNPGMSTTNFKTYLATQKAAGTPVTVWYVCEMPIEENPPVPLPALPTVDGTTIVDYAGQSAVPSRFVAKYRKR